ncbi:MAG TPA: hypothetical protein VFX98_10255, partial [Longimicrobiaceae bacterium]|nr:hypothetical protein [Longimicrobiaceae bacterium]
PEEAAQHPERVAQHYEAAGLAEPAVDAWTRAGRRAVERSDSHEAVEHLRQGLELLASLPPGRARDERELALRLPLGPALTATQGHAAAEVRECYLRALELARALGVEAEHLEIMGGLFASHFVRSEVAEAFELAREMLRSAAAHGDSPWIGAARVAIGVALLKGGSLEHARDHLEEGLRRYDPARHFALAHAMGQDYGVVGWGYSAYAHFALGDAGEALRRAERAAELARALDHPHSLAMALAMLTFVRFFRREPEPALPLLDELEALAGREGFHHWEMDVPPMRAWALAALGRTDEALAIADEVDGAALLGRAGVGPGAARVRVLAEAYLGAGRPADAARLLADVVERLEAEAPEAWWLAEAYRARAVALAQLGNTREAGALLERAAWSARAAGTPLFLLRALLELARLRGGADAALRAALDEARRALPGSDGLAEVREAGSLLDPAAAEPVLVVL